MMKMYKGHLKLVIMFFIQNFEDDLFDILHVALSFDFPEILVNLLNIQLILPKDAGSKSV